MTTVRPRKRFGQHFLNDGNIIRKIIANIRPASTDHFVEIGPGRGAITLPLLASGARLDAIEVDRDLARELPGRVQTERCTVHCTDALAFDFSSLAAPGEKLRLVGNLPYNISTPLLFHFLRYGTSWRDLHVMLQKEVGERIAAEAGNKTYGRLTVALALRCRIEAAVRYQPGQLHPPAAGGFGIPPADTAPGTAGRCRYPVDRRPAGCSRLWHAPQAAQQWSPGPGNGRRDQRSRHRSGAAARATSAR